MGQLSILLLRLLAFCACCFVGACANSSIAFSSLRLVHSSDSSGRSVANLSPVLTGSVPNRDLIRVEFTASADLRKMAKHGDTIVFLHSYFCDRGDNHVGLGGPDVYVKFADVDAEKYMDDSNRQYVFFLDVTRKAQPKDIPPEQGFDLSVTSEDICFFVTAHGALITTYTSSGARIPKAAIHQELGAQDPR
jgi:hypothetical protein